MTAGKGGNTRILCPMLVIGTSAVDVGVDFRIHLLIFEAGDSAIFVQDWVVWVVTLASRPTKPLFCCRVVPVGDCRRN